MKRISDRTTITYQGECLSIAEWSSITGLSRAVLTRRYRARWSPERILLKSTPSRRSRLNLPNQGVPIPPSVVSRRDISAWNTAANARTWEYSNEEISHTFRQADEDKVGEQIEIIAQLNNVTWEIAYFKVIQLGLLELSEERPRRSACV